MVEHPARAAKVSALWGWRGNDARSHGENIDDSRGWKEKELLSDVLFYQRFKQGFSSLK